MMFSPNVLVGVLEGLSSVWDVYADLLQNDPGASSQFTDPDETHEPFRKAETLIRRFRFGQYFSYANTFIPP